MKKSEPNQNSKRSKTRSGIQPPLPPDWNERKIRAVIKHYDRLTDDELAREIETAPQVRDEILISIPAKLLQAVQRLIVRHQRSA